MYNNGIKYKSLYLKGNKIYSSMPNISPFSTATDEEIKKALNLHYAGKIDISQYWNVGDTRVVHINATNSGTANHVAQNMTMVIMDFNHDDLSTPINGVSKAAVSVGFREIMGNKGNQENEYYWGRNQSYVSDDSNYPGSPLRNWLNGGLLNALPPTFSSLIKEVNKKNLVYHTKTDGAPLITKDKIWLLSYPEIYATEINEYYINNTNPKDYEGTQYKYFETSSNRLKYINNNGQSGTDRYFYWLRSTASRYNYNYGYCWVVADNNNALKATSLFGNSSGGLAPAFCL